MADLPPLIGVPIQGLYAPLYTNQPFLARQGPIMNVNQAYMDHQRESFNNKLIIRLVDDKPLPPHRLQYILDANWKLRGHVHVRSKYDQYYKLEFADMDDLHYILSKGPWVVQNRLMAVHKWISNTTMRTLHINIVDL